MPATQGSFDGNVATATSEGVPYTLGPVEDWSSLPQAARYHQRGNYVLVLRSERKRRPLGILAVRPQLAVGIQELVQTCQHYGVELAVISNGHQLAVEALAHRARMALLEKDDAVEAIRALQQNGAYVVFVSDNARAAAGFAACDLAIGLTDDRSHLPARADLLAPDLTAVAAVIEAASQREAAVREHGYRSGSVGIGGLWQRASGGGQFH